MRDIDVYGFYWMRAARILPSLLLALAIIVVLGVLDVPFFNNGALRGRYRRRQTGVNAIA